MRRIVTLTAFLILSHTALQAQTHKTYKVAPGERVSDALLKAQGLYLYPQFNDAQVTFKNGNIGGGRMNYNKLLGELQFINPTGDTLTLDKGNEMAYVSIGNDTFFYKDGFIRLIADFNTKIASKTMLELANRQRIGGMGEAKNGGTASYTSMSNVNGVKDLVPNEILTFAESTSYFIGDRFNRFKPLNKKSLYSFYAKNEKQLDAYFNANPVNFFQEADVLRLIDFLKTL